MIEIMQVRKVVQILNADETSWKNIEKLTKRKQNIIGLEDIPIIGHLEM
jgi:hypothetical protein